VNWSWDYGDGTVGTGQSNTHQYGSLGTFVVTLLITDNSGCVDSVIDSVKVKDISTLYIPNSFTPNGDGHNDLFLPYGLNVDPDTYEMMIFDRWGQMLFDTKEWGVGWNGTLNNHGTKDDVVLDVYVYKIKAKPIDGGKLREYYGRVFLFP
jgi:gliding motility-associated-like protein